ncbi:hypothetical protein BBJ28_00007528 [Nothophytophthora sp. Chile5]|nr:hypothetical protein BBJ28_00007528 [Nothophytophthora sp. Chile5]
MLKNTILYVFNNHRFPKWFYSYDSSITRTQREMTHHLAAYVFQVSYAPDQQQQHRDAVVLARHASPGFTLVSYRRAGNANHTDRALPPLDEPADSDIAMDVDGPEIVLPPTSGLENTPEYSGVSASMRSRSDNGNSEGDDISATTTIDAIFWQQEIRARESGLVEKGQHLFILWQFLRCVSLQDVGFSADTLEDHLRPHWLRAAAVLKNPSASAIVQLEEVMVSFLTSVFSNALTVQTAASSVTDRNANQLPVRDQAVIQASTQLLLRAIASPFIQYLLRSAFEMDNDEINTPQLHERFAALISNLYDAVSELLLPMSPGFGFSGSEGRVSLPELVDEVLSLIYSHRRFGALRREVSALLMSKQTAGPLSEALNLLFRAFTAQARETLIAAGSHRRGSIQRPVTWPGDADTVRSPWSRRWLLEPGSIQVDPIIPIISATQDQEPGFEVSVVSLTRWLHEFACIDIAVRDDAACCSVRSAISLASATRPMELVLDGRLRVFRVMPSGLSSMVGATGGWAVGDYSASFLGGTQSLEVNFFAFAEEKSAVFDRGSGGRMAPGVGSNQDAETNAVSVVRRVSLTFMLEQELVTGELSAAVDPRDLFLFAHGVVAESSYTTRIMPSADDPDLTRKLSEMSTGARAVVWGDLQWKSLFEMQAGYVAVPCTAEGTQRQEAFAGEQDVPDGIMK